MSDEGQKPVAGVPQQILEKFLKQLEADGISPTVMERLRGVVGNDSVSEAALKKALLPDE